MRFTSGLAGFGMATLLHVVLLGPAWLTNERESEIVQDEKTPAVVALPAPEPPPTKPPQQKSRQVRQEPPRPSLKEVTSATAASNDARSGDTAADEDSMALPELRIKWRTQREVLEVTKSLGMRILAVNGRNEFVGELVQVAELRIVPFKGNAGAYSNRVRTLPATYFGEAVLRTASQAVALFMILVPADLDTAFIAQQREAIARDGFKLDDVLAVDARFVRRGGTFELQITQIHRKDT